MQNRQAGESLRSAEELAGSLGSAALLIEDLAGLRNGTAKMLRNRYWALDWGWASFQISGSDLRDLGDPRSPRSERSQISEIWEIPDLRGPRSGSSPTPNPIKKEGGGRGQGFFSRKPKKNFDFERKTPWPRPPPSFLIGFGVGEHPRSPRSERSQISEIWDLRDLGNLRPRGPFRVFRMPVVLRSRCRPLDRRELIGTTRNFPQIGGNELKINDWNRELSLNLLKSKWIEVTWVELKSAQIIWGNQKMIDQIPPTFNVKTVLTLIRFWSEGSTLFSRFFFRHLILRVLICHSILVLFIT